MSTCPPTASHTFYHLVRELRPDEATDPDVLVLIGFLTAAELSQAYPTDFQAFLAVFQAEIRTERRAAGLEPEEPGRQVFLAELARVFLRPFAPGAAAPLDREATHD